MKKLFMVLPLALILCFVVGCQDKEAMAELEAMRAQAEAAEQHEAQLSALVDALQRAWDDKDMKALAQHYAEDAVMVMPGEPEPVRGRDAIEKNQAAFLQAMPDFDVDFTLVLVSGDYIVCEGVAEGTFTGPMTTPEGEISPTGKSAEVKFAFIGKVNSDGLLEEDKTYFDNADFMSQLGIME
jgi:uncharacterized protein (TIGR02246 family)